mgnify:CR=1 FL=1
MTAELAKATPCQGRWNWSKKAKEGGAHKIPQGPHGLQAGHDARTNFAFDKDTVDIDDDIHEPQRGTETNGRKNRQSIDRHIAQEIQKGSDAQSGDSQGTTAARRAAMVPAIIIMIKAPRPIPSKRKPKWSAGIARCRFKKGMSDAHVVKPKPPIK